MGRLSEYNLSDLFKFEKRDITSHMMYEMKLTYKFKDSFNYLTKKLKVQKLKPLNKIKWDEGKNYDWAIVKEGLITFIIRTYRNHFTIFFKNENKENDYRTRYGCFMFNTDTTKLSNDDSDARCDNCFVDLDEYIKPIHKLISDGHVHLLWNNAALPRPDYIEIKPIWNGSEDDINYVDDFIFCCEELFGKHLELFAQTDMLDKLKTIKVGDMLNRYEVLEVRTEVEDDYYHDAGLKLKGTNGVDSESWNDVYSLTRYYLNDIFPKLNLAD